MKVHWSLVNKLSRFFAFIKLHTQICIQIVFTKFLSKTPSKMDIVMPAKLHLFKCQFVFISMLRLFSIRMFREVNRDNSLEFIMIFFKSALYFSCQKCYGSIQYFQFSLEWLLMYKWLVLLALLHFPPFLFWRSSSSRSCLALNKKTRNLDPKCVQKKLKKFVTKNSTKKILSRKFCCLLKYISNLSTSAWSNRKLSLLFLDLPLLFLTFSRQFSEKLKHI